MKNIKILILLLSLISPFQYIFGQSSTISGLIVEKESLKPIGFASVYYEGTGNGTISNTEGRFSIQKLTIDRNLIISCIGYKTVEINKEKFTKDSLKVLLEPDIFELKEIVIIPGTTKELLNKSIRLKLQNYPLNPTLIKGFYKQINKQNGEYIRVLESDLSIYRPSYKKTKETTDKIKIFNALSSEDKAVDILYRTFVLHQMLRASKFTLDSNYSGDYKHILNGIAELNKRTTYKIAVQPINKKGTFNAEIYVDKESFAISAIDFKYSVGKLIYDEKAAKTYRYKNKRTKFCTKESFHYFIRYKLMGNKWHLNYIHADNKIVAFNKTDTVMFEDKCDFLVNEIIIRDVKEFNKKDIFKSNMDIYSKGITDKKLFNNPNKILDTKKEKAIRDKFINKN